MVGVAKGLGKAVAAVTGVVSALCFVPTLPGALLSGMEADPVTANHLATAPLLLGVSAAASLACIARVTIVRFVLAFVPFTVVMVRWFA